VAEPLESAGGVVDGLAWSEGGVAGAVLEESLGGVAGAVADWSLLGVLGEVDCCFEQATRASALRHNNRTLRFIGSPLCYGSPRADSPPGVDTTFRRKTRSMRNSGVRVSRRAIWASPGPRHPAFRPAILIQLLEGALT